MPYSVHLKKTQLGRNVVYEFLLTSIWQPGDYQLSHYYYISCVRSKTVAAVSEAMPAHSSVD